MAVRPQFTAGTKTTSGTTQQALHGSSVPCNWVELQCPSTNTGACYVQGLGAATTTGYAIAPGGTFQLPPPTQGANCYDLALIYIEPATSGNKVSYLGFTL